MTEAKLISAFLIGLMSSAHCLGMCGGISVALGMNVGGHTFHRFSRLFAHSTGRILCYALLGLLVGSLSQLLTAGFQSIALYLRVFSGLMLIAMGLYIAQWWMGLTQLETVGQRLWKKIQPQMAFFKPVDRLRNAFMLGLCWGLLPCGLVYSVLVWSAASQSALNSTILMFFFGLGTMPAMVASGFGGSQLKIFLQNSKVRTMIAMLLCCLGVWTISQAFGHH